jgi:membrane protein DedA with SNARE-associated domain
MTQTILDLIDQAMASPWLYAALFALAALDAFIIVLPSESAIITAGVFAATGGPELLPIMAVAAAGAMLGDHLSYGLGYRYGARFIDRLPENGRREKAFAWARSALQQRGGMALVVARYVPGGRTAVTLTTGAIRFPVRSFVAFDALAAGSWAVYCTLVGYLGGAAFENNPLYGVVLGVGFALALAALIELVKQKPFPGSRKGSTESVRSAPPVTVPPSADRPAAGS